MAKKQKMKHYTNEKLKKIFIICGILGVITFIPLLILGSAEGDFGFYLLLTPLFLPCLIISYASLIFMNWKKAIIGVVFPIPVLSYMIETFKGVWKAIKAFIALIRRKDFSFEK